MKIRQMCVLVSNADAPANAREMAVRPSETTKMHNVDALPIFNGCHRSHFGSRYKLGCCGHAGLFGRANVNILSLQRVAGLQFSPNCAHLLTDKIITEKNTSSHSLAAPPKDVVIVFDKKYAW